MTSSQEYAEKLSEDPSQFYDDEPEESKTAATAANAASGKVAKKVADGKVAKKAADAKEKNFQDAIAEKAAKETAQKEIDTILAGLKPDQKAKLLAAQGVVASPGSAPRRSDYDHETKQMNLVKNTAPVRALMETLKDDYECVYYMGALCDYWKSLMLLDRTQDNEHTCFINYFKKERHLFGLPLYVPASPGSKNVSRGVTPFVNEDEEAGAGAGSP